jgi:uncharacterized protein YyaL (SSP411 family)
MTNRLINSASLYLRKHAENPIDWWPWCDEAINTARQDNKPIFLSIGYSSCHWCTVMEGEAFADLKIAEYMNANFIPIKVDREERPDIDSIYMQALQLLTGQGGWPLNVFLTPDQLIPFVGGTYFPVDPRYGRPGFLEVLQKIRHFYDLEKTRLESLTGEVLERLQSSTILPQGDLSDQNILAKGIAVSQSIIGDRHSHHSFPMIPYAHTALRHLRYKPDEIDIDQAAYHRGLDLALGGIYDHVAGGFHRYTVDPTWTVPHFEKMLYDNGQIMEFFADLWSAGYQEPALERAIAGTYQWLKREMTDPAGYFYAAQDADSFISPESREPEEGAFYVWSYQELQNILTASELNLLMENFTITQKGNFEGNNVLQRKQIGVLDADIETALAKLFQVRYGAMPEAVLTFPPACDNQAAKSTAWPGRIPAVTDPKMIVAWNGLMISGLAKAAMVFGNLEYYQLAVKATQFIIDQQWQDGRLQRVNYQGQTAVKAQSEDYAFLIKALLDLQQASLVINDANSPNAEYWLNTAIKLQNEFDQYLWSIELGGYYNTANDASQDLLLRERNYQDNATPAANGIAIANLIRLARSSGDLEYLERSHQGLLAFSSVMRQSPQACPSLINAFDWHEHHTLVKTSQEKIQELSQQYFPYVIYEIAEPVANSIALVCPGLTCNAPATNDQELLAQLQNSQKLQTN